MECCSRVMLVMMMKTEHWYVPLRRTQRASVELFTTKLVAHLRIAYCGGHGLTEAESEEVATYSASLEKRDAQIKRQLVNVAQELTPSLTDTSFLAPDLW